MKDAPMRGGELSSGAPRASVCLVRGHCPLLSACASSQAPHRDATVGNVHGSTGGTLGIVQHLGGAPAYCSPVCSIAPSNDCALSTAYAHGENVAWSLADEYIVALFTTSKTYRHRHRRSSPPGGGESLPRSLFSLHTVCLCRQMSPQG